MFSHSSRKAISTALLVVLVSSLIPTSFASADIPISQEILASVSDSNIAITGATNTEGVTTSTTSSSSLTSEVLVSSSLVNTTSTITGTTNTGIISTGTTNSGITSTGTTSTGSLTGSGASGSMIVSPPIDYSTYSYYSGTWTQDGTTYGNSFYPNSLGLTVPKNIQVLSYDAYTAGQKTKPKQKQGMMKESESMMTMSAMSAPTNGLVVQYTLNGNANDSGPNVWNGAPNYMTWPDSGKGDGKLVANFNETNAHIHIPNNISVSSDATFSFSMKYDTITNAWAGIISKRAAGNDFQIMLDGQTLYALFWTNGPAIILSHDISSLGLNTWHDFTYTYKNPGLVKLYIDGVYAGVNVAVDRDILNDNFPTRIGHDWYSGYFKGNLSNVSIYNRVLSDSEILSLGNTTPPVSNDTNLSYINPNFQSNLSLTFLQYAGNDNHVALSNDLCKKTDADTAKNATDEKNLADPVNLATGEFTYDNTLMSVPGVGLPYQLKIQYKNQATYNGPLGFNWDHNYNQYLSGETNGNVFYYNGQLGTFRFIKSGGVWLRNEGLRATLVLSGSVYSINYDNGNKASFNSINRLSNLTDINGNALNFTYSGSYLSGVIDTLGRTMSYSYYSHNRLKTVTDFGGRKADFIYYTGATASGNLYDLANIVLTNSGVTKTIGFEYSTSTTDPLSHNITKLIDAKGQVYVDNTYTAEDRVATQRYGSASLGYTYTLSGSAITQNTVLDKLGNRSDYTYDASGNNTAIRYYNPAQTGSVLYSYTYNALGLMTKEKRPRGNGYTYAYDANGNLTQKRFKTNADAVDSITDLVTNSTYNARNEKMTETNPNNTSTIYTRDTNGNILTKSLSGAVDYLANTIAPLTTTYTYLSGGLLQTMTSPYGIVTKYGYTAGQMTSIVKGPAGITSTGTFVYSPYGTVSSATDGDGFTKNYGYTVFDLVSTGTTAESIVTGYAYDANNNKTRETRHLTGGITANSYFYYDSLDHLTSSVVDTGTGKSVTTTYTYDANGNVTDKKVGSTGAVVHYTYNEFSKPIEERILLVPGDSAKDIVTVYTYDTNNNLASTKDPRGHITTYTYDLFDRVTGITNPQSTVTNYTYNSGSLVDTTTTQSSTGLILSKQRTLYDNYGHTIKTVNYLDPINSTGVISKMYAYNPDFQQDRIFDENGVLTNVGYNLRSNKIMTSDQTGNSFVTNYNLRDLKIKDTIRPSGGGAYVNTNYTYDRDGRMISVVDNLNKTKSLAYDNLGSVIKSTDEMNRVTNIERDYRGLMTKSTSYSGAIAHSTTYTYDDRGNMTSILDPIGRTTSYQYDTINRNTKIVYPDMKEQNLVYDKSSNLTSRTDPNGTTVTNTYDSLNHLIARTITTGSGVGGVTNEIYSYDALGRLTSGGDNTNSGSYTGSSINTLTFTYDALSRLTSELEKPVAGTGYTVGYTYYATSDIASIMNPDNKVTGYTYDAIHRPLVISYSGQTVSTNTYTGVLQTKATYQNSKVTNYAYDGLNRPTTMNAGAGIPVPTYTYNDASDILGDGTKSYTYDGLIRLISATSASTGASTESYIYDKTGNRTLGTLSGSATSYTTNTLDQYILLTGSTSSGTLTYDNNGNLTNDGQRTYKYDYNNRLIEVNIGTGNLVKYNYDILGRRTKKSTSTETITYVYSGDNILSEYKTIGTGSLILKKNYINGIGTDSVIAYDVDESTNQGQISFCQNRVLPYSTEFTTYGYSSIITDCNNAQNSSTGIVTNRYYYHTNQLGSVIALTNSTGTVMQIYSYDSFGKAYVVNGSGTGTTLTDISTYTGSTYSNSRLYTGREYDKEINLYYLRARYYNQNTGKFISRDPVGQNDQINLYTYVKNSPLMGTDRDGKKVKQLWSSYSASNQRFLNSDSYADNVAGFAGNFFVRAVEGAPHLLNLLYEQTSAPSVENVDYIAQQIREFDDGAAKAGNTLIVLSAAGGLKYGLSKFDTKWTREGSFKNGSYAPSRELPRTQHGTPTPDSQYPHTQLGVKEGRNGTYNQGREWGENGQLKRDIDFTDHGRPDVHTNPHSHDYIENITGGTKQRSN